METSVLEERRRFVRDYARGAWTMRALCARYGITPPCGYKWWARFQADGDRGLAERSRAPRGRPHQTAPALEALIVAARREYGWGAKKLQHILRTRHPAATWPARSTFNAVLERYGLLEKRRRRLAWPPTGTVALQSAGPNEVWPADFKGQFKTGDGRYCYPLTITDHFSRQVLAVRGLAAITQADTRAVFRQLFREVGLPAAIRTDNGAPFASIGLHGLSALNIWWMQLGVVHQRIRRGRPQENGTHERMHRELKRETARPPAADRRAQQARFDRFRRRYNDERPHEALDNATPASRWQPSARPYSDRVVGPEYPGHWEIRRVSNAGAIRLHRHRIFLSQALHHQDIGLEEIDDGLWQVVYYRTVLGVLDAATGRVTGVGRSESV